MIDADRRRIVAASLAAAALPAALPARAVAPALPGAAQFAPLVGSQFLARPLAEPDAASLRLTLASVESFDARTFALRFDVHDARGVQGTYAIAHPALVPFGALLVPSARGDSLTGIFNRAS